LCGKPQPVNNPAEARDVLERIWNRAMSLEPESTSAAPPAPTIADQFADVIGTVSDLPEDMAAQHDHYVHGAPKSWTPCSSIRFSFFAILNPKDAAHTKAIDFSRQHTAPLVTTTWVLTEVADGLSRSANREALKRLIAGFRAVTVNEIVVTTDELFGQGVDLYDQRRDKQWSLTVCISFVVMKQRGIQDALTGDHHYEQAGFTALLN
jgi:uncharacterized protein